MNKILTYGIRCLAFDCFHTVFNINSLTLTEIRDYSRHVNASNFTPFEFPPSWWRLKAHPGAAEAIQTLQDKGFICVTLSNGSVDLLKTISRANGIEWDHITDLVKHRAYKPKNLDAYRAIEKDLGGKPEETLMVTANPTFGDIESSKAIGMPSFVGHPMDLLK